jgi:hypothetical protein
MITREQTMLVVWRCPGCSSVYDGEGLQFLYTDEVYRYCPCGVRVVEELEPETEHRYRLMIPERLRGTRLHHQLEQREAGETVDVEVGGRSPYVSISCRAG